MTIYGTGSRCTGVCVLVTVLAVLGADAARAQDLADFDYENLTLRGVGVDWGYLWPDRVEPTRSFGVRVDLGYLGPGLRLMPSVGYWTSRIEAGEVDELEGRVAQLVARQTNGPPPSVDLGTIEWSDLRTGLDAQVVWALPGSAFSYAGLGAAVHLLNGDGAAINDTFIEDLLDSVTAGFNVHAGMEYPIVDRLRVYGQGRYEVMGDLRYFEVRTGLQVMTGLRTRGEERAR